VEVENGVVILHRTKLQIQLNVYYCCSGVEFIKLSCRLLHILSSCFGGFLWGGGNVPNFVCVTDIVLNFGVAEGEIIEISQTSVIPQ
jgi:hypothetical protein